jgi:hypothetical protein
MSDTNQHEVAESLFERSGERRRLMRRSSNPAFRLKAFTWQPKYGPGLIQLDDARASRCKPARGDE